MDILISIKPRFVQSICEGKKIFEYRKRKITIPFRYFIIYSSSPVKKIVAYCNVVSFIEGTKEDVWNQTSYASGISKQVFDEYYCSSNTAVAYKLSTITVLNKPIDPNAAISPFNAPQSYCFIDEEVLNGIIRSLV